MSRPDTGRETDMTDLHLGASRQNSVRIAAAILTFLLAAACGTQPSVTTSPSAIDFGQPSSAAASSLLHETTRSPAVPRTPPAISTTAASIDHPSQTTVSSSAGKTSSRCPSYPFKRSMFANSPTHQLVPLDPALLNALVCSDKNRTTGRTLFVGSSLALAEQLDKLEFVDGAYSCGAQTGPSDSEPEALAIFFYSNGGPVSVTYGGVGCSFITNGHVTVYSNSAIVKEFSPRPFILDDRRVALLVHHHLKGGWSGGQPGQPRSALANRAAPR